MTDSLPTNRLRLAVLISGSGRTLANLLERSAAGSLAATVDLVLANRDLIGGLEVAAAAGVPSVVLPRAGQPLADWRNPVFDRLRAAGVDLVVMAGVVQLLEIPPDFTGRVINIHPSLLPAFGGKGFYGDHVHRAVLERGCTVSGCTVHFVDNEYDHGRIILQQAVPVLPEDDHERLAVRVFKAECDTLPAAINQLAALTKSQP